MASLERMEAMVLPQVEDSPAAKRNRCAALPADLNVVVSVYQRFLETLNASTYLSVLKVSLRSGRRGAVRSSIFESTHRKLVDFLWRWAHLIQSVEPNEDVLSHVWNFNGRLFQQMVHADLPVVDAIDAARRALARVTHTVPPEGADLKKMIHAMLSHFEYEPLMKKWVVGVINLKDDEPVVQDAVTADEAKGPEVHMRVVNMLRELVPSFRGMCMRLTPETLGANFPQASHLIQASPTPMRSRQSNATTFRGSLDGETMSGSEWQGSFRSQGSIGSQRSFGARSRSPRARSLSPRSPSPPRQMDSQSPDANPFVIESQSQTQRWLDESIQGDADQGTDLD